ncbi:MAG: hypothetical protein QMD85_02335 [Candidatus Aenigmarchaeota archaeon]|nr:hypothetical protein [Candidatus Aenigmarchaeota archaeon]MDI6722376.1 hypothetical protein [Candidatus Aenigmarchaeota archaeon]
MKIFYWLSRLKKENWEDRHERAKRMVGEASSGSTEYYRNAAIVLSQHAGPGMRYETREKLIDLSNSSDPETRRIARDALHGTRYPLE